MRTVLALAALLATTSAALAVVAEAPSTPDATPLPRYDVQAICGMLAGRAGREGGDVFDRYNNACVEIEQTAYDALRSTWSEVPEDIRSLCADQVERSDYSKGYHKYDILLNSCVEPRLNRWYATHQSPARFSAW